MSESEPVEENVATQRNVSAGRYDSLIPLVRRVELQRVPSLSVMGLLQPLQNFLTRRLIRWAVDPRWVTVAWLLLSLVSYAVSAVGMPWTFLVGAVVLFIAITLDLSDGEIGRAAALRLTPQEDLRTFIYGMYLDRISHAICTPIWPLAIAWGLLRMTGQPWVLGAGLSLAAFHTMCRVRPHLKSYLREYFRCRILQLKGSCEFLRPRQAVAGSRPFWHRIGGTIELWVRNGKRFNFVILLSSLADVTIFCLAGSRLCYVLFTSFMVYGLLAIGLLVYSIVSTALGPELLDETCQPLLDDGT